MKERMKEILNIKLNDINNDIKALIDLNEQIDSENGNLNYVSKTLEKFKENESYNILNFVKLSKEDFSKVLSIVSNDVEKIFDTPSCNYDGLIYLINGINSGVSISLTEEQKSGIEYLIRSLNTKEKELKAKIDELNADKARFRISDVDSLNKEKESFEKIINDLDQKNYVSDIDKVSEAVSFAKVENEEVVSLLKFLLEYNADVYKEGTNKPVLETPKHQFEETHYEKEKNDFKEEEKEDNISLADLKFTSIVKQQENEENDFIDERKNIVNETSVSSYLNSHKEDLKENESFEKEEKEEKENKFSFFRDRKKEDAKVEVRNDVVTPEEYHPFEIPQEENDEEVNKSSFEEKEIETKVGEMPPFGSTFENQNHSFGAYYDSKNDVEENTDNAEKISPIEINVDKVENNYTAEEATNINNDELQKLFDSYNIKLELSDKLNSGNFDNYKEVIETLKDNKLLDKVLKNNELFTEMLLSTGKEEIEDVLSIVKNDLSVDNEDYEMTSEIVVSTLPTVFIRDGGNYSNFIRNVQLFKEYGLNLIKLFDFSKEIFVVPSSVIEDNYAIIKKYNVTLDYRNAKYLLVLADIAERMDYYVESVYPDKTKNNEKFDGINYINQYTVKLSIVKPETIKRLRYASINGKKVFGSKPNSLAGEITNLKVRAMDMPNEYLDDFFDNHFDGLTEDEVRQFTKLVRNSSNVGNYADELDILDKYREGDLRLNIDNILVSYNKVLRNYNILRSYGINTNKALHFAVCYNLVITKEEYNKLKETLNEIGGNA